MPTHSTDVDAAELRALLAGVLEMSPNEISNSSRLVEDLGVDSLASPKLAVQVENYYGISIRDSHLAGIDSFTDMLALVRSSEGELSGQWPRARPLPGSSLPVRPGPARGGLRPPVIPTRQDGPASTELPCP